MLLCVWREKPLMTSLYYEEKEQEILLTLVTWVTSRCVSNGVARARNVTWPSNLQKLAFSLVASAKSRARHPLLLTTFSVPGCVLWRGIPEMKKKVTKFLFTRFNMCSVDSVFLHFYLPISAISCVSLLSFAWFTEWCLSFVIRRSEIVLKQSIRPVSIWVP